MDEHENDALHAAFQAVLSVQPEPILPSVTDAAVAGGRRIRRRRAVLAVAGTQAIVASVIAVAVNLSWVDGDRTAVPMAPVSTTRPTPHTADPFRTAAQRLPPGDR
jgi:hypothetical protein